jgi:hypothetical protein
MVWSVELLSTTKTSQVVEGERLDFAMLSSAFAKLWQRLYVHITTVTSITTYTCPLAIEFQPAGVAQYHQKRSDL